MLLNEARKKQVVILLQTLKCTSVPRSVDSGEAITYLALKDIILENAIGILGTSEPVDETKPLTELCVDHQQLANAVLERTFDAHMQLLRQKLKKAEEEADMWRQVTLFGRHRTLQTTSTEVTAVLSTVRKHSRCQGTQTCSDDAVLKTNSSAMSLLLQNDLEAVEQWFTEDIETSMALLDKKVELFCSASFTPAPENKSPLENIQSKPAAGLGTESGNFSHSLPEAPVANTCSSLAEIPLKANHDTKCRKPASAQIVPIKSPTARSPVGQPRNSALSSRKQHDGNAFARQGTASPDLATQSFKGDNSREPLYILQALQLKPRSSVSSSSAAHFTQNDKCQLPFQLPQL